MLKFNYVSLYKKLWFLIFETINVEYAFEHANHYCFA